jgi:insulysin
VKDPVYLQERIEAFLSQFRQSILQLKPDEFEQFRGALIANRMEDPKNLGEETYRYWNEITGKSFNFNQLEAEIEMLKQVQLQDIVRKYDEIFIDPKSTRKIAIQAFGKKHPLRKAKGSTIDESKTFKERMAFYPNPPGKINTRLIAN